MPVVIHLATLTRNVYYFLTSGLRVILPERGDGTCAQFRLPGMVPANVKTGAVLPDLAKRR
jgi:hypothetical protein